jgi:outer membrane protein OmpA-like peptidoglycan-associated protein
MKNQVFQKFMCICLIAALFGFGNTSVYASRTPRLGNEIVFLGLITFDVNSVQLSSEAQEELRGMVARYRLTPSYGISVMGHTDNTGNPAHNLRLSKQRAEAVAEFLNEMNLNIAWIFVQGFGQEHPIVENDSVENRTKNRRVEVSIIPASML